MKLFKGINQGIQGDVMFTRVEELPADLIEAKAENGFLVVAHSETGHNHAVAVAVAERPVKLYEDPKNPLLAFLVVNGTADLEHQRTYDKHETVKFDEGVYRINRQREHTPEGLRRVAD